MREKRVSLNNNLKYKQKKLSLPTSMTKTNIWPHIFVLIFLIVTACSGNCIDKVLNKIRYNRVQTIWRKTKKICHVVENLSMLTSMSTLACYFRYSIYSFLFLYGSIVRKTEYACETPIIRAMHWYQHRNVCTVIELTFICSLPLY